MAVNAAYVHAIAGKDEIIGLVRPSALPGHGMNMQSVKAVWINRLPNFRVPLTRHDMADQGALEIDRRGIDDCAATVEEIEGRAPRLRLILNADPQGQRAGAILDYEKPAFQIHRPSPSTLFNARVSMQPSLGES